MAQSRFDRLNSSLPNSDLDAVILNPGPTLTHLTGLHFHLMERPVVFLFAKDQDPAIVLPELELQKVASLPYQLQVFPYPENPAEWDTAFRKATQALGLDGKRIGVEPRQLRLLEFRHIKAGAPEAEYPDASDVLSSLRLRKDQAEIEAMRRAVKIAQNALEATLPSIKIGMTEKELSSELVVQLLKQGSEPEMPFAPIVSGGPNGPSGADARRTVTTVPNTGAWPTRTTPSGSAKTVTVAGMSVSGAGDDASSGAAVASGTASRGSADHGSWPPR